MRLLLGLLWTSLAMADVVPPLLEREIPEAPAVTAAPATRPTQVIKNLPTTTRRDAYFWAGPGMAIYSGERSVASQSGSVGFGIALGAAYQIAQEPLYVGADLGFNFWNFDPARSVSSAEDSAFGLQLLPTVLYKFDPIFDPKLNLYAGVSLGPNFYFTRIGDQSEFRLYLEVLLRPGVAYEVAPGLAFSFEPKFGVLRSELIFLPHLMANLSL